MANLVPILNLPFLYANGCKVVTTTTTSVTIQTGQLRDFSNVFDIVVSTPLVASTAFVGAGGLDTGTVAASTVYAVYVISDVTNVLQPAALLSQSSTSPVMPSVRGVTYSTYRLVGYVYTDGSSLIRTADILGNGNERINFWATPIAVLTAGAAAVATAVNLSAAVPGIMSTADSANTSCKVTYEVSFTPASAGNSVGLSNAGSTVAASFLSGSVAAVAQRGQLSNDVGVTAGAFTTNYTNSAGGSSTTLNVSSFQYYI